MKNLNLASFLIAVFICLNTLNAQTDQEDQTSQKIIKNKELSNWAIGVGLNIVEDDGGWHGGDLWDSDINHFSNPFVVSVGYISNSKFSFFGSISFNKFVAGKSVQHFIIEEGDEPGYMAIDLASRFSFRDMLDTTLFDPYIHAGFGYSKVDSYSNFPEVGNLTLNTGLGINFWFSNYWGFNLNYSGKWGVESGKNKEFITNRTQLSFGFFHRFSKKASSKI